MKSRTHILHLSDRVRLIVFFLSALLLALTPLFVHMQWFTGPLVNALLFATVVIIGPAEAIFIGLIPSTVALMSGLLPLPLAPMIPFIMIGNAIMILSFFYIYKKQKILAVLLASFLKFVFLYIVSQTILTKILDQNILSKLAIMMSWSQFFTACIGGFIALLFIKFLHVKSE